MSAPTLDYFGNAGLNDMGAFNARLHQMWRGDNLFRLYITDESLYFIRVGGSRNRNAAIGAQFGLLGGLVMYFANKRAQKKQQQTLNQIAGSHPRDLIGTHKYNFVLPVAQVASTVLLPPAKLSNTGGRGTLVPTTGKKLKMTFDDVDNMKAAVARLGETLGPTLSVQAEYDATKNKYRKPGVG